MKKSAIWTLGMLLVGIVAGAGGAHALQTLETNRFLNTGLFTVDKGDTVAFSATLDDNREGPSARIALRLIDRAGTTVARRDVTLSPGQSATLTSSLPGVFRAQAHIVEPDGALGDRRLVLGTVEIARGAALTTMQLTSGESLDLAIERRFVCSHDDGGSNGRLPD